MLMHMYSNANYGFIWFGTQAPSGCSSICRRESKYQVRCGNTWTSSFSCRGHRHAHTHFKTPLSLDLQQLRRDYLSVQRHVACTRSMMRYFLSATRLFCYPQALSLDQIDTSRKARAVVCRILLYGQSA